MPYVPGSMAGKCVAEVIGAGGRLAVTCPRVVPYRAKSDCIEGLDIRIREERIFKYGWTVLIPEDDSQSVLGIAASAVRPTVDSYTGIDAEIVTGIRVYPFYGSSPFCQIPFVCIPSWISIDSVTAEEIVIVYHNANRRCGFRVVYYLPTVGRVVNYTLVHSVICGAVAPASRETRRVRRLVYDII